MTVTDCIPDDLLPAFLEGELPDEDSAVCEEHLLTCSNCLERTRSLQKADTVAAFRESGHAIPNDNSPAAEALMQQLIDRDQLQTHAEQSHAVTSADTPTVRPGMDAPTDTSSPLKVTLSSDLNAGDVLGPYRILSKLGQGGMGAVYKATHIKLDKVVALKILSSQVTRQADAVTRFEREMRAVGKLEHPHIVRAMDAGEINGIHYLAMEYVDGTDLQQLVKNRGKMSVVNACKAIRQSAMALAAAHAAGLVHRDIKPSNLLVGKNGQIKLLDLGLALLADDAPASADLTTAGQSFGTPDYMAPEQWEDAHAADARTDLYALGCTLFFLLVGRAPYATEQHRSAVGKMFGHVTEAIPDLKAARPDVPAEVVAIYEKLLAKSAKERFQTATELVEALAQFVSSKTAPAASPAPVTEAVPTVLFQPSPEVPKPAAARGGGRLWTPRQIATAAGGAAAMLLLGVIVITILNKDGTKTEVEVPGDAKQVTVTKDGKSLVKVTTTESASWHGWPAAAPRPAIAPFDAAQAKKHQEEWATYLKVPVEYTNSIGMKFRLIPPGEFLMGSTPENIEEALREIDPNNKHWQECAKSEGPQQKMILTQPIYLSVCEVTQAEYEHVTGQKPSSFSSLGRGKDAVTGLDTSNHPVESVSWNDAAEFCTKLSQVEKLEPFYFRAGHTISPLDGTGYRLPQEAEWEYACRAGTSTKYWTGDSDEDLVRAGWFGENSGGRTHAVGELLSNPFGLYDIHGNVQEWCHYEWGTKDYDRFRATIGPEYTTASLRIIRNGDFANRQAMCGSSRRWVGGPPEGHNYPTIGFRVALPMDAVKQALKSQATPNTAAATGWHGWPADAPKPAIAPFDAAQAKKHQEEWATYLKVPVEYTNSIGMKFRLIPPGEFLMGSTQAEMETSLKIMDDRHWRDCIRSEFPQRKVTLTQPIYLSVHEVTQTNYQRIIGTNPAHFSPTGAGKEAVAGMDTARHPVEMVSWNDAANFCARLSQQEQFTPRYLQAGEMMTPLDGMGYRLPSEAQWEFACRAGTNSRFWIGEQDDAVKQAGWIGTNSGNRTHAAGELLGNPFGIFDVHGNAWEWMEDSYDAMYYNQFHTRTAIDPLVPFSVSAERVLHGGDWLNKETLCRSSSRYAREPSFRNEFLGFRVALPVDAVRKALKEKPPSLAKSGWHGWPADAPKPAIAPFDAAQAKQHQEEWTAYLKVPVEYTNSIGMKFRLIPPGEFTMGSTSEEIAAALKDVGANKHWQECIKSEAPPHKVILTQPIYQGVNEVTQGEYEKVMGRNPAYFAPMGMGKEFVAGMETASHPVETVSWNDAAEFCAKLSKQEKLKPFYFRAGETITPLDGTGYRLPSEAEWEFACRAGTATKYWIGDKDEDLVRAGWFGGNAGGPTHAAGELKANPFGLADIHGNVWEWVHDGWDATNYGQFQEKPAINPNSPFFAGSRRVIRGGGWLSTASNCRSTGRDALDPSTRSGHIGFRVSLTVDAVKAAITKD